SATLAAAMNGDGALSQNSTQVLERSLSPQEQAQRVRDELEGLGDRVWDRAGVDADLKSRIISAAAKATIEHLCPQNKSRRRLSVLDRTSVAVNMINTSIAQLSDLWDTINMSEEKRLERANKAYEIVEQLMTDMVASEGAMVTAIQCQIGEYKNKVTEMRRELGMKPFDMNLHPVGSIALWKALEADMDKLNEERDALILEQKAVIDRFAHLTSRLGSDLSDETAASLPDTSVLAPRATVAEIRERCVMMEQLLAERVKKVVEVQKEMNEWIQRTKCDYDENVAAVLEVDVRAAESALTADLMDQMDGIRQTMADAYSEWLAGREFEYREHIERLAELWEMCCVDEEERRLPRQFDPALLDSLEEAKAEVDRLEGIYERRKEVYEKMGAWKTHWAEKLQFESSENSLDKYTNRGGALDQRIKYENRLVKQLLPQAAHAVAESYTAFLRAHPEERIYIEGMEPLAYIHHLTSTHDLEREMEKEQKAMAKKAQLQQESKWGSAPGKTLLGRRPLGPASSATRVGPAPKVARMGTAAAAAAAENDAAAANFTFDQSAISSISPKKKADGLFPKTSSPKGARVTVAPGTRFATPGKAMGSATPKRPPGSVNKK
ncbi:hypothetical protein PENTCL1PPCAC_3227, partial [Pristionchus entomophagus]